MTTQCAAQCGMGSLQVCASSSDCPNGGQCMGGGGGGPQVCIGNNFRRDAGAGGRMPDGGGRQTFDAGQPATDAGSPANDASAD
jgi:hypothetical protein